MHIYLPIAGVSANIWVLLAVGTSIGFLSGLLGVGGGFLMTPILIFMGIPSPVAVGTGDNQVVGASVSGVLAHWKRGNVDVKMGTILLIGGFIGSSFGVWLSKVLREMGQIDLVIALSYVIILGTVGGLMAIEAFGSLFRRRGGQVRRRKLHTHNWMHDLPFKMRFRRSRLYISAIPPLVLGAFVGILAAGLGMGGGFVLVPAMIYFLGMPTSVVVGTSLYQIMFVTGYATLLQAVMNHSVDVVLALLLLVGSVVGAQVGARFSNKVPAEQLRALLAALVLGMGLKLAYNLVVQPHDVYSLVATVSD